MTAAQLSNRTYALLDLLDKMEEKVRIFHLDDERQKRNRVTADLEAVAHHRLMLQFAGRVSLAVITEGKERASRLLRQGLDINDVLHRVQSWIVCAIKPESVDIA